MKKKTHIDQLNQERAEKIDKKIALLKKDLRNAQTAYNRAEKNRETDIEKQMLKRKKDDLLRAESDVDSKIRKKQKNMRNIDNQLIELKSRKKDLKRSQTPKHIAKVEKLTDDLINHLWGSYKEKKNPTPHESGRNELPTKDQDEWEKKVSDTRNKHNIHDEQIEFTPYAETNSIYWDSALNTEAELLDTVWYNLWDTDISPDLMEALKFYEEHEEPNTTERLNQFSKNHQSKTKKTNQYDDVDKDFYGQKKYKKLSKKKLKKQEIEEKYSDLEENINLEDDHKIKLNSTNKISSGFDKYNPKNKKNYRRYQHIDTEPANRVKKKNKTRNIEENIQKYGFVT